MSSYCSTAGLFGAGTSQGVVTELISLGAIDTYLIKGASVTFFRFRYARHTNFAMETVGQQFNTTVQFGNTSSILLNRAGDLLYWMYVVIQLPGIYACRGPNGGTACNPLGGDPCFAPGGYQYPGANNACGACECTDAEQWRRYGAAYGECDPGAQIAVGKAAWLRNNYGACYNPCTDEQSCCSVPQGDVAWVHWSNAVGQLLIKEANLVVGSHQIACLYSDFLYMWEELSGKSGKRLREMIGKRKTRRQLIEDAKQAQRLYVPLPWYFTMNSGNVLPLCTLQFNGVQIHITFEQLQRCVCTSHSDVFVKKCCDNSVLCANDLDAWIDTTYIYLDIEERNRFSLANFDTLVQQVQSLWQMSQNGCTIIIDINFNHPVIELIWAIRRKCNECKNNWFNYSGIDGRDPIEQVNLLLNNMMRFSGRQGRWYRLVQPYQHHSSIPKAFVYCYSFALLPEEAQPSGSCNFSRIDTVKMVICLQEGLGREQVTVLIFARNWNIVRYNEGLAGLLFH